MSAVVVVGGGWTGAVVARRLARAGTPVVVLEGGPRGATRLPKSWSRFEAVTEPLTKVDADTWAHEVVGATFEWLRVRALGGRTLLWGAWMDRPARGDGPRPWAGKDLDALVAAAERWLDVKAGGPIDDRVEGLRRRGLRIEPKRSCTVGGARPLTAVDLLKGLRVRSDVVVRRVLWDARGVRGVDAIETRTRRAFTLDARAIVLAASPFETFRILKESAVERPGLGAGWTDHLVSGAIAIVEGTGRETRRAHPLRGAALIRMPRRGHDAGSCVEIRGPTPLDSLDAESLRAIGIDRDEARRLAYFAVFSLGELTPRPERRVTLHAKLEDGLGRPRLRLIVPRLSSEERAFGAMLDQDCSDICEALAGSSARVVTVRSARQQGDSGHEVGGCSVGVRSRAVVDADGAVYDVPGLYVADGSRLPRALPVHPSLTLAALALATATRIGSDLK